MTDKITINPAHDPVALGEQLRANGRIQITDFLEPASAEYVYQLICNNRDWYLAYNDGSNYYESELEEFEKLPAELKQRFMADIHQRAQKQFQYLFNQYYITQAIEYGEQPGHPMHQVHHWINSEETLEFMRQLTGDKSVVKADSYASSYAPGHFLTQHDDRHHKHDRAAAYVISLNKDWDVNWGGHLAFYDDDGNIDQAFLPSFNTLNMFLIPQQHAVQPVSAFAGKNRTSYLGWLHRDTSSAETAAE